ncbi:MAG: bifunctional riboflavin kinase/FAD synthetase [Candidatus Promineifilaceae bacterium]
MNQPPLKPSFQWVTGLDAVPDRKPTCLAIGVFDGVHRGHQQLLARVSEAARAIGARSAAMTFDPHPRSVIPGQTAPEYLSTLMERVDLIGEQGIDLVIVQEFTAELRQTSADDFVDNLCASLDLKQLWGAKFGLGYKRQGDFAYLSNLGKTSGFTVHRYENFLEWKGQPISSSLIRHAVREGRIEDASSLLGRSYRIRGEVIHGDGRGALLGIPTANLSVWEKQAMPMSGVYGVNVWIDEKRFPGAANVGFRPTVNGHGLVVEAHLIGFQGDLYGQEVALDFEFRVRDEKKFPDLDALVAQIKADIEFVTDQLEAPPQ